MKNQPDLKTPSSLLKELAEKQAALLSFSYINESQQDHLPRFACSAFFNNRLVGKGTASSKKAAKHQASLAAIEKLARDEGNREKLRELYVGKEEDAGENPISELNEVSQRMKRELKFESQMVCRVFVGGVLAATAESDTPISAKQECCKRALDFLQTATPSPLPLVQSPTFHAPPLSPLSQSPSETYLIAKDADLCLSPDEITESKSAISAIFALKSDLRPCGVFDLCLIGAAAAGCIRRNKLIIDVGLVSESELDMRKCAAAVAPAVIDPGMSSFSGKKLSFGRIEADLSDKSSIFTLKFGSFWIKFVRVSTKSPLIRHSAWLQSTAFSPAQRSAMRLIRYWRALKPEKRTIPPMLIDYAVAAYTGQNDTLGRCFRRFLESVAGGVFLPGRRLERVETWQEEEIEGWSSTEKEAVAAEAFVTMVQMAREEIASLV